MIVARIYAELAVGAGKILLEDVVTRAFRAYNVEKGINTWEAQGKGFSQVGVGRYPAVYGPSGGENLGQRPRVVFLIGCRRFEVEK